MLDIIILSNSSKKDVLKSLNSVLYQIIECKLNIYVVDYNKKIDYSDIVKDYSKIINIFELKCDKNINIGNIKQYALDNSNGKYIIFMNSGDEFAFPYAINLLLDKIKKETADVVWCNYHEKIDKGFMYITDDEITLNSKIYRRKFIENNKIKFNDINNNSSFAFNKLIEIYNPKKCFIDASIYVAKENNKLQFENGRYEIDYFNSYIDDVNYLFEFMKKNKFNDKRVNGELSLQAMFFSYLYYLKNKKILKNNFSKMVEIYLENKLSDKLKNDIIINCLNETNLMILIVNADISFKEFIKRME